MFYEAGKMKDCQTMTAAPINVDWVENHLFNVQGVSKKMVFSGKTAMTSFELIQNAKSGGVLENSGYLLRYGH